QRPIRGRRRQGEGEQEQHAEQISHGSSSEEEPVHGTHGTTRKQDRGEIEEVVLAAVFDRIDVFLFLPCLSVCSVVQTLLFYFFRLVSANCSKYSLIILA